MTDHPITPPRELVTQWCSEPEYGTPGRVTLHTISEQRLFQLLTRSAQWGADQELEACCELLKQKGVPAWSLLRSHRRPKLPSLKKQALEELDKVDMLWATEEFGKETLNSLDTIRRALEALSDD